MAIRETDYSGNMMNNSSSRKLSGPFENSSAKNMDIQDVTHTEESPLPTTELSGIHSQIKNAAKQLERDEVKSYLQDFPLTGLPEVDRTP